MGLGCSKSQLVYPSISQKYVQTTEPVISKKSSRQTQTSVLQNKIQLYNSLKKIEEYHGRRKRQFIFA